jgi:glutamine amidotransferase-like uncharacterized protein
MKFKHSYNVIVAFAFLILSACEGGSQSAGASAASTETGVASSPTSESSQTQTPSDPSTSPTPSPTETTSASTRTYTTDALLFVGSGTWGTEISNLRTILSGHGATYKEISSAQLNAMSVDDIAQYGILIFPGGSGGTEAGSLSSQTHANLREAVQKRGVSYIGFCAGAFIAQAPAPSAGGDVSYGLGIVDGPELDYYELEYQGQDLAMTLAKFPDGSTKDLLYYGGPVTPNIPGGVVAQYPNGDPMITQVRSGSGFVMMVGTHPTASTSTLSSLGLSSSDGAHQDYAWTLINAALHEQPLPAF